MGLTTILVFTLFQTFASTPNLCDLAHLNVDGSTTTDTVGRHLARYCQWAGPGAPVLDAEVCCDIDDDGAACSMPDVAGRCAIGGRYSCEYGAKTALGGVICYQPFPSACDMGLCIEAPELPPTGQASQLLCCSPGGVCEPVELDQLDDCIGGFLACNNGVTNTDGTVDCYD